MALNFPDPATQTPVNTWSPTSTPSASTNGLTYLWDGAKWTTEGGVPNLHWTRAGSVLSPTNAGDDVQIASLNSGPLSGFRNALVNGDFRVWQRGSVITTGNWGSDRWAHGSVGATVSEWRQRLNGNVPECPVAAEITSTGASGDYIIQSVELPSAGNAGPFGIGSTWTLSFWANVDMISNWNQSHCLQFRDGTDAANNIVNAVSAGNAAPVVVQTSASDSNWKKYAISGLTIDTAPAGSNLCLNVRIKLPTSAVRIGQIQLEPGPVATPFEQRPIGTELALCQRYYEKSTGEQGSMIMFSGDVTTGFYYYSQVRFTTTKRATPTFVVTNTAASRFPASSSSISGQDIHAFRATRLCNSTGASGFFFDDWTASAEL